MKTYSRIRAVVDLDAVMANMEAMHRNIDPDTKMIAVIKTDGYGHGSVQLGRMFEEVPYIWGYAVATLDEGVVLRKAGLKKPILCLGCIFPDQYEQMVNEEIRMAVTDVEHARLAADLAHSMGKKAYVHVKLDTGMSRIGFPISEQSACEIAEIAKFEGIKLEGMFTHFARADEFDKCYAEKQMERYLWMKEQLLGKGVKFTYYHCSNSAGIIDLPQANMDLVRAGISIYGLYPSEEVEKKAVPLIPAMEIFAHVTHVKWIEEGTAVSYGGTFVAPKRMRVATVPVGYGDGYPRSLSNKGYMLIRGKKAPILGRVCMDQTMVDVTDIPDVAFGDQVTIVGRDGDEFLPVEVLSDISGRFNYEFVCDLNKRVPREYVRGGEVVEQVDYF